METKSIKAKAKKSKSHSIRVANENRKWMDEILKTANKKEQGRSIKIDDLLSLLREKVQASDIERLQTLSLTNEDRKELLRQSYIEKHGPISKDEFVGFMLTEEFQTFLSAHRSVQPVTLSQVKVATAV